MEIKVRTKEQQAIDNLKAIINSKDEIIEIEPPIEDTAQILLDIITNLKEELEEKTYLYNKLDTESKYAITNLREENENLKDYLKIMEKAKDNNLNRFLDYKSRCEKSLKALHNSKEYKVMKELEFNKNMSILIKLDKLLGGDDNE